MRLLSVAFAAVLLTTTGCGISGTTTKKLTFHVNAETDPCGSDSEELDLGGEDFFNDYKDKIDSVTVKSAKITIVNPKTREDSVATMAHGTVSIQETSTDEKATFSTFSDVALTQDNSADLSVEPEASTRVSKAVLKEPHKLLVTAEGCADAAPAYFDFELEVTFDVTAHLL